MFIDNRGKCLDRLLLTFDITEIMNQFIPMIQEGIKRETTLPSETKDFAKNLLESCLVEVISDISLDLDRGLKLISGKMYSYNMFKNVLFDETSKKGIVIEDTFFSLIDEVLRQIAFKVILDIKNCYNLPINTKFNFYKIDFYSIHILAYLDDTELL